MTIDKLRAQMTASVWQSIAQSGIDLSVISKDQQEKLVSKIADGVLMTMDTIIGEEISSTPENDVVETDERILWKGRPFLSLVESYTVTSERLRISTGLVARHVENFELIRVQDIDFEQGIRDRVLGIGDIIIHGHDPSTPDVTLRNVSKPEEVYEIIRRAWLEARKRHGLQFSEFM